MSVEIERFVQYMDDVFNQVEFMAQMAETIERDMKGLIGLDCFGELPEEVRLKIQIALGHANLIKHTAVQQLGDPLESCGDCACCLSCVGVNKDG